MDISSPHSTGTKKFLLFLKQNNEAFFIPWRTYSNNNCFHCLFPSILKMWEASHKMKAIYYIIYRKWSIKKTTWDLDYLDKIQSSEQWTEENCIKSGRLLKHVAKYPLKIPPTKTIRHGRKGQMLWQEFSLILTLKNNAHKARNRTHLNVHGYP